MPERAPAQGEGLAPEADADGSRGMGLRLGEFRAAIGRTPRPLLIVSALGAAAALSIVIAQFLPIASIDLSSQAPCNEISNPDLRGKCSLSGFEKHSVGLVMIAAAVLLMAIGAGVGRSRPAAIALVALGVLAIVLAMLVDFPETRRDGLIRDFAGYEAEDAKTGAGFYLELLGAALAMAAGALRLTRRE